MKPPRVREQRERLSMSQRELAERVGVSRQALHAIESGGSVPSVVLAQRLALQLASTVESLFPLAEEPLTAPLAVPATEGRRAVFGKIHGAWVAHALTRVDPPTASHGVVVGGAARLEGAAADPADTVLLAGCSPALGVLVTYLNRQRGPGHFVWLCRANAEAERFLGRGLVHAAAVHRPPSARRDKRPQQQRFLLADSVCGFVLSPALKSAFHQPSDLAAGGLRVVQRELGSGSRATQERWFEGAHSTALPQEARSHAEVACAVALGVADVGVAPESVAREWELAFLPAEPERIELLLGADPDQDLRLRRLVDALTDGQCRADLRASGFDTGATGKCLSS